MTIATGNAALAADVAAIRTLATTASTAASVATANAATALSNSVAAQAAAAEALADAQGGVSTYTFAQGTPATTWVILHNMNRFPGVVVVDSRGSVAEGDIVYDSSNQITLTFSAPFAGTAYFN